MPCCRLHRLKADALPALGISDRLVLGSECMPVALTRAASMELRRSRSGPSSGPRHSAAPTAAAAAAAAAANDGGGAAAALGATVTGGPMPAEQVALSVLRYAAAREAAEFEVRFVCWADDCRWWLML